MNVGGRINCALLRLLARSQELLEQVEKLCLLVRIIDARGDEASNRLFNRLAGSIPEQHVVDHDIERGLVLVDQLLRLVSGKLSRSARRTTLSLAGASVLSSAVRNILFALLCHG